MQTIADDNREFIAPDKMIAELLNDNRQTAVQQRAAIETCDENKHTPTGHLLQEVLDQTERRIWFPFEISKGECNEY